MRVLLAALLATVGLVFVAPPAQAASQAVMMQGYAFSPSTLTVHAGDTVTWTNHDQAPHDVTTTSAPVAIKSQTLSTGQSFSYTFTTAGTYSYYCSIHPDMRAQVIVQPAPAPAPAPAAAPAASAAPKTTVKATTAAPKSSAAAAPVAPQPTSSSMAMPEATAASPVPTEQPAVAAATTTTSSLNPMLLVAGVAAGIAVLCLLVLGSRRQT
ncbi:MAG TPA: cupredoxin family copper-binding protein [Amycolatopsis sp.]|nr:cupredoxin family copper-binding protein [Amycolatopsis sp.]